MSPLHSAVISGNKDLVELLITNGAEVNVNDVQNRTPLDFAQRWGTGEIVELLKKHGAK
jgi:ankyrin repeat protein